MSPDQLKQIAKEAAAEAVRETLVSLGIDTSNPIEAQRDFAKMRWMREFIEDEKFQANWMFLDRWRTNAERVTASGIKSTATFAVSGLLGLLAFLTKDWWITHFRG